MSIKNKFLSLYIYEDEIEIILKIKKTKIKFLAEGVNEKRVKTRDSLFLYLRQSINQTFIKECEVPARYLFTLTSLLL